MTDSPGQRRRFRIPRIIGRRWWRLSYRAQFGHFVVTWHYAPNRVYDEYDRRFTLINVCIDTKGVSVQFGDPGSNDR